MVNLHTKGWQWVRCAGSSTPRGSRTRWARCWTKLQYSLTRFTCCWGYDILHTVWTLPKERVPVSWSVVDRDQPNTLNAWMTGKFILGIQNWLLKGSYTKRGRFCYWNFTLLLWYSTQVEQPSISTWCNIRLQFTSGNNPPFRGCHSSGG
jgi:hypothetical protein